MIYYYCRTALLLAVTGRSLRLRAGYSSYYGVRLKVEWFASRVARAEEKKCDPPI